MQLSELTSVLGLIVFLFGIQVYLSGRTHKKFANLKVQLNNVQKELTRQRKRMERMAQDLEEESFNDLKLYVGNIDYSASEEELESLFQKFGRIEFVNIPVDKYSGRARGFGFVTFDEPASAAKALELNGCEFKGRQIQVNFAKERAS